MPSVGQRFIILSALMLLVSNSLPSFWGHQDQIVVSGLSASLAREKSPTTNELLQQADDLNLIISEQVIAKGHTNLTVRFTDTDIDAQAFHSAIQSELEESAEVKLNNVSSAPQWFNHLSAQPIKLGLDLSGGALFVLEVDTQVAMNERLGHVAKALKAVVRQSKLSGTRVDNRNSSQVTVSYSESRHAQLHPTLKDFVAQYDGLYVNKVRNGHSTLQYTIEKQKELTNQYVEQALVTMRSRIEQLGITEGVVQRQGQARIRIEIPGIKDLQQAERLIGATAGLAFHQFAEFSKESASIRIVGQHYGSLKLAAKPIFTGNNISDAQMGRDESGIPLVNLVLDSKGGEKMSSFSKENVGNPMVTLFSEYQADEHGNMHKAERIINVATIQTQLGNRFSITQMNSISEARELAMLLRAGSLDAPVRIVQKRIINASLGEQNVKNGMLALALGLVLTMIFMVVFYRRLGLIANLALLFNLACLTGLMALIPNAVLTLPGIAGLVLTVGMAVDTNVLIFERIRQEQRKGAPARIAMILGYKHAWTTILDANLTTLICALVMLSIGYGPVKGFAITLSLGILTSVFTGVALSRTLSAYLPATWLLKSTGAQS